MCVYLGSEVILANLLCYYSKYQNGIGFTDIEKYCLNIKKALIKKGTQKTDYIVFNVDDYELELDLENYSRQFKKFKNKYYRNSGFNINRFNVRITSELSDLMKSVAEKM